MSKKQTFLEEITGAYTFKGDSIILGSPKLDGEVLTDTFIRIPLRTLNRHGLIAGATGTGKTKTLQIIIEQLSAKGVPSLVMDIKGDLSGVAVPGENNPKIQERHNNIGLPFSAAGSPVEFLSLSHDAGARLRATVTEFGPVLFSKILELNDTQAGLVSLIFKFCDDNQLPLLDLDDIKKALNYISNEGKEAITAEYGAISSASVGTILRKIIELEQQGGDLFFGERSFDVDDLTRLDEEGKGYISILRVTDIQDKPKLFSTFMLQLLAEIYSTFPEEGDLEQPKLVIFIDEAHLIFNEASKALLNQIETIIKLIRSKGVGIFFVTQNPTDVPDAVLSQLGLKIQHALRAFTAKDRKAIKLTSENYPLTDFYAVDVLLTELGIGESIIAALNEKGIPTPLVHCYLRAPQSRMDVLSQSEIDHIMGKSRIKKKYDEVINRDSAYEILTGKIEDAQSEEIQKKLREQEEKAESSAPSKGRQEKSTLEKLLNSTTTRQIGRTIAQNLTRGLLGVLGVKTTTRRSTAKKTSWW
ncbi:MAG: helicase HerA-like domain-containing protein [Saprospiraceae bacterium]